jgi:hypothetical protein
MSTAVTRATRTASGHQGGRHVSAPDIALLVSRCLHPRKKRNTAACYQKRDPAAEAAKA